ncbi:galactokinase [Massilia sp. TS11]|uniref:galactokinase n=1 Tax=Massilia sp. TS11 TaxID=2908003 RepID=UPI001EDC0073|nr:galactokinase [Massilia sp. TS11]MCG2584316.1 galactokinase [Massilia sp. TS11]
MMRPEAFLGGAPAVWASAPGRVNLLGEHTDYNEGFMLPLATPQRTEVALAPSEDGRHHAYSSNLDHSLVFGPQTAPGPGFGRYLDGCMRVLAEAGASVPPLRIYVRSRVPLGAGLSSSAALEVATLRALCNWCQFPLDPLRLAQLAQQAEIRFAGVQCGILDQMAASLGDDQHPLLIDARSLAWRPIPLPPASSVIVIDSGVARSLAASHYNQRRGECQQAARLLGVDSLRDVADASLVDQLPEPYRSRARHVLSENARVLAAADGVDAARFGALMNASHASLRDDFAVSHPALDALTSLLRAEPGVYGARLTGAGFGGACVALCAAGQAARTGAQVVAAFNANGGAARVLIPEPQRGDDEPI